MRTKKQNQSKKGKGKRTKVVTEVTKPETESMPMLRTLSAAEMRRLVKPRTGYEEFVEPFAQMVERFAADIGTNGLDVAGMRASVRINQSLASPRQEAAQHLTLIDNTRFVESSSGWKQLLLIYGRAKQAARTNPEIALAIKSFEQFMKKHAPRAKKPAVPTP